DNRRPVDFARRREVLTELKKRIAAARGDRTGMAGEVLREAADGRAKLVVIRRALALRKAESGLFAGAACGPGGGSGRRGWGRRGRGGWGGGGGGGGRAGRWGSGRRWASVWGATPGWRCRASRWAGAGATPSPAGCWRCGPTTTASPACRSRRRWGIFRW